MSSGYYRAMKVHKQGPVPRKQVEQRERESRRRELKAAEQVQRLTERRERWRLEKWRGWSELVMKVVCFLVALAATITGSWSGEPTVLGGSGAAGLLALFLALQRSPSARSGSQTTRSSLPSGG